MAMRGVDPPHGDGRSDLGTPLVSSSWTLQAEAPPSGTEAGGGASTELTCGLWGRLTFSWLSPLIAEGRRREVQSARHEDHGSISGLTLPAALTEGDLYELRSDDLPQVLHTCVEALWAQELEKPESARSLRRALRKAFGRPFFIAAAFKVCYDSLQMAGPYVLRHFLRYLERCDAAKLDDAEECSLDEGLLYVVAMFCTAISQTLLLHQYFHRCFRTGMRLNCATITLIYSKALRIGGPGKQNGSSLEGGRHNSSATQRTTGEVVNLMCVDAIRLQDVMTYLHTLWSGPYQIVITLIFLSSVVGWATLAGITVMLLQIPITTYMSKRMKRAQLRLMKVKDERIKVTNEVFGAVRLLKMYGWEPSFQERITSTRNVELRLLRDYQILNIIIQAIQQTMPILVGVSTFGVYTLVYGDLKPSTAFTALSLFNVLRFPIMSFSNMVNSAVEANVALGRIQSFLESPEISGRTPPPPISWNDPQKDLPPAAKLVQATLAWPDGCIFLRSVGFSVPLSQPSQARSHLTVVLGAVGTGKSGLLQALIGDLKAELGTVTTIGTIAYTSQVAWVLNATVKQNIIFHSPLDEDRYNAVLEACALLPDLDALPNGDETEIGEKGVNLSGGQKQRVCLARAVYAAAQLLLLDDPLSAVDAEVAKKLMRMLRSPLTAGTSIVLCTHHVAAVHDADQVILLERDGTSEAHVAFCGAAEDFITRYPDIAGIQRQLTPTAEQQVVMADVKTSSFKSEAKGRLIEKESELAGSVKMDCYRTYAQAAGGYGLVASVLVGVALGQALQTSADSWVSFWSDHSSRETGDTYVSSAAGLMGYVGFSFAAFTGVVVTSSLFRLSALKAARFFHEELLDKMLRLPMVFYDTTPLGRVLNRFSADIATIDEKLQQCLYSYLQTMTRVAATIIVVLIATPWFVMIVTPLLWMYRMTKVYYIPSSRQLKRIESNLRSPIFSHFAETLDGVASIRAFGQQAQFFRDSSDRVCRRMRAYYLNVSSNRWLAVRLETMGTAVTTSAGLLAALGRHSLSAGVAGLSISYSISVTQSLNWMVRMSSDMETNVVAVERVKEYMELDTEPAQQLPGDPAEAAWPSEGRIVFEDVRLRYRPELPLVLESLSLQVNPREKLGICGRTGAGKSSVLNVLLRIVDPEEGQTLIDGVDIAGIGLHRLRHSLTIIPQDPVLFSGTLRFNLDPLGHATNDRQLWQALSRAHLAAHAETLVPSTSDISISPDVHHSACLAATVAEKGANFSVGQRQQLCLTRALVREANRILLLDEATSAVDIETDALIQQTIYKEFASHTILCIAHRISTIMECDRVCVMESGRVAELGPPKDLMQVPESRFRQLAKLDAAHD